MKDENQLPRWLSEWKQFSETANSPASFRSRHQPPQLDPEIKEQVKKEILRDQLFSGRRILFILLASILSLLLATLIRSALRF